MPLMERLVRDLNCRSHGGTLNVKRADFSVRIVSEVFRGKVCAFKQGRVDFLSSRAAS